MGSRYRGARVSADDDATHECGGERFVPVEHHRDAHRKIKALRAAFEGLEVHFCLGRCPGSTPGEEHHADSCKCEPCCEEIQIALAGGAR